MISPTLILDDVDIDVVAHRIAWGKFVNSGQTCIAPDYVLCSYETLKKLLPSLKKAIQEYYGNQPSDSDSYGKIVNNS